ncbi:MAG TPA: hypothetical protein VNU92_05405 [Edaphobacter sp.]|jgi:tetratricopeptide (TPR) repeat protein|nr:hypothetical protein [Edaphobacter sp.]
MLTVMLAFALLTTLATAHSTRSDTTDKTNQVIQKAIAAMGGIERIHALHSLVYRGFHFEGVYKQEYAGSKSSSAVLVRMRPRLRLVGCRPEIPECDGLWSRIVESFDGQHGWELNWPKQRLVRTVNKAEQALRCGAEFDFLFIDYTQRGLTASYLGRKSILGKDAEAIQVDQPGCSSAIYYFQPETYELLMSQLTIPIHARGDLIPTVAVYPEFKSVNGVRLPSRSEEINLATGEVLGGSQWTSIEPDTLTDPKIFQAPTVHPTGITAIVLQMLKQADTDSPQQMFTEYSTYRASPEGKTADVAYDMNWLGYELLKVDKYDHALLVFNQIITENPNSPEAWENLGEAYLQKSDRADARRAFQKSIDLGSKSEDIRRKLTSLQISP